jgi:hypothetical protein
MIGVQIARWCAALLLCSPGIGEIRQIETQWVLVSEPVDWKSPPREIGSKTKTGFAEVIVLYPSGEYGYVACYLIHQRKGDVSISRGDSHAVMIGTWRERGGEVEVTSHVVYQDVRVSGRPIPGPATVERYAKVSGSGLRRIRDKKRFLPLPSLQDLRFLATLVSCDGAYWDGQKELEGPQPCMPPDAGRGR